MPTVPEIESFLSRLLSFGPADELVDFLVEQPHWLENDNLRSAWELVRTRPELKCLSGRISFVRRVVEALQRAEGVDVFDDFAREVNEENLMLSSEFRELVQRLAEDSHDRFSKFFAARKEFESRVCAVNEMFDIARAGERSGEVEVEVIDEATLFCISALARFEGEKGDRASAEQHVRMLEELERFGYNRMRHCQASSAEGQTFSRRVLTSGEAHTYWISTAVTPAGELLVGAIRRGEIGFDLALRESASHASKEWRRVLCELNESQRKSLPSREYCLSTNQGAFCVFCAAEIGTIQQARYSERAFRALLVGAWWTRMSPSEKATTLLRYSRFLLAHMTMIAGLEAKVRSLLTPTLQKTIGMDSAKEETRNPAGGSVGPARQADGG